MITYNQIRCIVLRVLQTSKRFQVFLFHQSSDDGNWVYANSALLGRDSYEMGKTDPKSNMIQENCHRERYGRWLDGGQQACLSLASEGDIRRIKRNIESNQSIEYPPRQGNCIVLLWVLSQCLISTVYKHKYLRDIKLLLAVGFARFESFLSQIQRPDQSSHQARRIPLSIRTMQPDQLIQKHDLTFGKCPKITIYLSTARDI